MRKANKLERVVDRNRRNGKRKGYSDTGGEAPHLQTARKIIVQRKKQSQYYDGGKVHAFIMPDYSDISALRRTFYDSITIELYRPSKVLHWHSVMY